MTGNIHQILYCSRNCMHGTATENELEITKILASSRRNNVKLDVTGALLFNTVFFAQVLEGPLSGVEKIFESIQRDIRHSDLIVLQSGHVPERNFPIWSMAFAGVYSEASYPSIAATLDAAFSKTCDASVAGMEVLALLRSIVVQEEAWALPNQQPCEVILA